MPQFPNKYGKTLVVYYSASGNTKDAASYIAAATGGDMLELVPVNAYSSEDLNYRDSNSRVTYEHDHPEARDIELVENTIEEESSIPEVLPESSFSESA